MDTMLAHSRYTAGLRALLGVFCASRSHTLVHLVCCMAALQSILGLVLGLLWLKETLPSKVKKPTYRKNPKVLEFEFYHQELFRPGRNVREYGAGQGSRGSPGGQGNISRPAAEGEDGGVGTGAEGQTEVQAEVQADIDEMLWGGLGEETGKEAESDTWDADVDAGKGGITSSKSSRSGFSSRRNSRNSSSSRSGSVRLPNIARHLQRLKGDSNSNRNSNSGSKDRSSSISSSSSVSGGCCGGLCCCCACCKGSSVWSERNVMVCAGMYGGIALLQST